MNIFELKKLPMDYLWEGLILKDDVYNYNGTVLLIPSGEEITAKRLNQLGKFSGKERFVMTPQRSYEIIMSRQRVDMRGSQKDLEEKSGYTDLKEHITDFFEEVKVSKKVNGKQISKIAQDAFQTMKMNELSVLMNCIDTPRPMDEGLQRHSLNVGLLNGMMAQSLALDEDQVHDLILAGILHDVGKTLVPQEILDAPRKLTPEEFAIIRNHPRFSYELLGEDIKEEIRLAALYHHERIDGKGYPEGISGNIPAYARITSVADVYEALCAKRSYKQARIPFDVLQQLSEEENGLDPAIKATLANYLMSYFRGKEVTMVDGTEGIVCYVPPNDITHPIILVNGVAKQTTKTWHCLRVVS